MPENKIHRDGEFKSNLCASVQRPLHTRDGMRHALSLNRNKNTIRVNFSTCLLGSRHTPSD